MVLFFFLLSACVVLWYSNAPAMNDTKAHDSAVGNDESGESEYPRARYKSLLEDYEFLREEKLYGRIFPVRFVKTPPELRKYVESGHSLLFVQTRRRKYPMYVIVPNNRVKGIRAVIEDGTELGCVYSPVSVYRFAPVVLFIDGSVEISQDDEKEDKAVEPERKKEPVVAAKPKTEVPVKPGKSAVAEKPKKTETPEKPKKTVTDDKKGLAGYYPCKQGAVWTIRMGKDVRMIEFEILDVTATEAQGIKREMVPNKPEMDRTSDYRVVFNKNNITTYEQGVDAAGNPFDRQDILLQEPLQPGKQWTVEIDRQIKTKEIVAVDTEITAGREENPVTYKDVIIVREEVKDENFYAVAYNFYAANVGFIGCKIDSSDKKENLKKYDEISDWFMIRNN